MRSQQQLLLNVAINLSPTGAVSISSDHCFWEEIRKNSKQQPLREMTPLISHVYMCIIIFTHYKKVGVKLCVFACSGVKSMRRSSALQYYLTLHVCSAICHTSKVILKDLNGISQQFTLCCYFVFTAVFTCCWNIAVKVYFLIYLIA